MLIYFQSSDFMAKFCVKCGKKISFIGSISGAETCVDCVDRIKEEKKRIELEEDNRKLQEKNRIIEEKRTIINRITETKSIDEDDLKLLRKYNKKEIIEIFNVIINNFEQDDEVTSKELDIILEFKKKLELTNDEINFDDRILPHQFVVSLRTKNALPVVNLTYEVGASVMNLKKGEIVHFACPAILKEVRMVSLGYSGGSRGVSLRLMKGVSYRVGSHRGQMMKEEQLVEVSKGYLVLTNKRILLNPYQGKKAVNIPLNKVLTYNCYNNGLEIYKEGREKGFFFTILSSGHVEVIGLVLDFLLKGLQ